MTNHKPADWIQAELDGTLDEGRSAELRRLIAAEPSVRGEFEQMARVFEMLDSVETVEPPPRLKGEILRQISAAPPRAGWLDRLRQRPFRVQFVRYAYVLAAGLFLGFALHPLTLKGAKQTDLSQFYGTMSAARSAVDSRLLDRVDFDGPQLSGSVVSRQVDAARLIELDLTSAGAVTVVVDYERSAAEMVGFAQDGDQPAAVRVEGRRVELGQAGARPLTLFLAAGGSDAWADVEIRVDGELVHDGRLRLEGTR